MLDLSKNPIIYVTRDIERALGLNLDTPGYYIISNSTPFAKGVTKNNKNVLLVKKKDLLDTWELLQLPQVGRFINNIPKVNILVFKNTPQIEKTCAENNWKLLNPPAQLSNQVEEKISQIAWLGELKKYLPNYKVKKCKDIKWNNKKFVLQFNRSHTGSGTILVKTKKQLADIQKKFPERECRLAPYISGPLFTNNNIVAKNKILLGNVSYQITGLKPFTDLPFATIGNDWALPHKYLSAKQWKDYKKIATAVGKKLQKSGWRGLFGIDVVTNEKTGKLYLLEINCRQPASTTYESQLQQNDKTTKQQVTTFEAHLKSLLGVNMDERLIKIKDGAQIIQRVTPDFPTLPEPQLAHKIDFKFIKYNNTKPGSDLLRIQTKYSLMLDHNKLNEYGKMMIDFITVCQAGKVWDSQRGGIIAIKNNKVLLMERHKFGNHFFSIPGGTNDYGEDIKTTAKREGKEETNLDFTIPKQEPLFFEVNGRKEYYYFVDNISGTAKLSGEEKERSTPENHYELKWVDIKQIKNITLLPKGLTEKILEHYGK